MKYLSLLIALLLFVLIAERSFLPKTTSEMKADAISYGEEYDKRIPENEFRYDGCTLFPDQLPGIDLRTDCLEHDFAYYYGGSAQERKMADQRLKSNVGAQGIFGAIMQYPIYLGVRIFGDTLLTRAFDAHWGFGHD